GREMARDAPESPDPRRTHARRGHRRQGGDLPVYPQARPRRDGVPVHLVGIERSAGYVPPDREDAARKTDGDSRRRQRDRTSRDEHCGGRGGSTGSLMTLVGAQPRFTWRSVVERLGPLLALIVLIILTAACEKWTRGTTAFLKPENWGNILRQWSFVGIIAIGMTFVIISGGIDLSVGSLVALAGGLALLRATSARD